MKQTKFRIIGLGDSYTFGFGVEIEDTYLKSLERTNDIEVINAGVPGYGTIHELKLYDHYLREFDHDLVILLFCQNDISNNLEGTSMSVMGGYLLPTNTNFRFLKFLLEYVVDHSQLARLIAGGIKRVIPLLYDRPEPENTSNLGEQEGISLTGKLIIELNSKVAESGAKLAMIFMDNEDLDYFRPILIEHDIPFLGLTPEFLKKESPTVFPNDGHWNKMGHKIAANAISRFLHENRLIPSRD